MRHLSVTWVLVAMFAAQSFGPAQAAQVTLGDSSLTAGIAGSGPLTLEQAKNWLAKPENHQVLQVTLPEGLAAGKDAVYIPEDNPITRAKIELGRQLYFDVRLSKGNEVSCADCHHPDRGYAFDTQFGVGIQGLTGGRNSPTSMNRILSREQFWDGRAKDLEAQAVGPIANPIEMGNTHEAVVKFVSSNAVYRAQFDKIFGRAPNIDDVGRAIATFERVIVTGDSPYDYQSRLDRLDKLIADEGYENLDAVKKEDPKLFAQYQQAQQAAKQHPMSESAKRGQKLFFSKEANCSACHVGANFSDEKYHNLGVGMDAEKPDLGRFDETGKEEDKGAFKTPTLRNVAQNAPYMHDGSQKTLLEVVQWYVKGGHPNPQLSDKIKKFDASEQDMRDLVAFMEALTGPLPKVEQKRLPVD
ncbi:MAG: c-type cytochrome [Pirellulaceae bacterium]|nr:c-type cytochrome [Pirellulaceae bacterium]